MNVTLPDSYRLPLARAGGLRDYKSPLEFAIVDVGAHDAAVEELLSVLHAGEFPRGRLGRMKMGRSSSLTKAVIAGAGQAGSEGKLVKYLEEGIERGPLNPTDTFLLISLTLAG